MKRLLEVLPAAALVLWFLLLGSLELLDHDPQQTATLAAITQAVVGSASLAGGLLLIVFSIVVPPVVGLLYFWRKMRS